jgi:hypothetical protein
VHFASESEVNTYVVWSVFSDPGYAYEFSVSAVLPDGLERESKIVWTAPLSFDTLVPNVSVDLEMGWFSSDDVVLQAKAVDVHEWVWYSRQLNTSDR